MLIVVHVDMSFRRCHCQPNGDNRSWSLCQWHVGTDWFTTVSVHWRWHAVSETMSPWFLLKKSHKIEIQANCSCLKKISIIILLLSLFFYKIPTDQARSKQCMIGQANVYIISPYRINGCRQRECAAAEGYETTSWRRGALQADTGPGTVLRAKRILSKYILIMANTNNENLFIQSQSGHTFCNLSNAKEMS